MPVPQAPTIAPEALRPRVEGDFANDRVKHEIMARLFAEPAPAARIGRFTVIRELGRGGTGVVYAAYDEQLERKIAVKLLHRDGDGADTRLLREAQAMARLSHPHIVSVHEVGTHAGQIYIAMEFVHGVTLAQWLTQKEHGWRDVVEVFRQAGSGLAAAHDVGLVHRDFKPQNAMVGTDGRVRVLDFGLARADDSPDLFANLKRTAQSDHHLHALDTSLTITGSLVGTPAFMAPEQFRGEKADARADQFALCVALYEALYRSRPFAGESLHDLMRSVLAGQVREPRGKLPRGLRSAILRGLQLRPEARHASMHALLAAIDRVVEPRRRTWLAGAVLGLGLVGGLGGMTWHHNEQRQICDDRGAAEIAATWNPTRAAAIAAALHEADPRADDVWPRAAARLDAHAARWQRDVVEACTAGEIRREQSQDLYDLRRACLDDHLRALESTLVLLEHPDAALAVRAADIVAGLHAVDSCADPQVLARQASTSADPALARLVADLRAELARADALRRATMLADADVALDAIAGRVPADDATLAAELALTRGRVHASAGRHDAAHDALQTAYFTALRVRHEPLASAAAIEMVHLNSDGLGDFIAAQRWVRHAQALLARGHDGTRLAHLAGAQGRLALHMGRYAEGQGHFERALDLYGEAGLSDTPEAAVILRTLADASIAAGELDRAGSQLDSALVVLRRDYCEAHPERAAAAHTQGKLALLRNDLPGALASFERAREDIAGAVPVDNPVYLQLTASAAIAYMRQGELARATTLVRDVLDAVERSRAAARSMRRLGPELFTLRITLASLLAKQGHLAEAEAEARSVLAESERDWGPDEPHVSNAFATLADLLLAAHRPGDALPLAERAHQLALSGADQVHPKLRYHSAFVLARVLDARDERTRAVALVTEARTLAHSIGDVHTVAELDDWLARHPAN